MDFILTTVHFKKTYNDEYKEGFCIESKNLLINNKLAKKQFFEITPKGEITTFNESEMFEILYCNFKDFNLTLN